MQKSIARINFYPRFEGANINQDYFKLYKTIIRIMIIKIIQLYLRRLNFFLVILEKNNFLHCNKIQLFSMHNKTFNSNFL